MHAADVKDESRRQELTALDKAESSAPAAISSAPGGQPRAAPPEPEYRKASQIVDAAALCRVASTQGALAGQCERRRR